MEKGKNIFYVVRYNFYIFFVESVNKYRNLFLEMAYFGAYFLCEFLHHTIRRQL